MPDSPLAVVIVPTTTERPLVRGPRRRYEASQTETGRYRCQDAEAERQARVGCIRDSEGDRRLFTEVLNGAS